MQLCPLGMMRQPSMAIEKSFVTVRFGRFNGLTGCCSLLTTKFEPICQRLIMSRGKDVLLTIKILHARVHPFEWKNINSSRRSTKLLENWWVKMEKRGSHWCVCVDSKTCKYILIADDRCGYFVTVKPLQATCRCLLLFVPFSRLSLMVIVCILFTAIVFHLTAIRNTKHELLRLLISGLSRALACSSDTEYDSTRFCSCGLCRRMVCAQFDLM